VWGLRLRPVAEAAEIATAAGAVTVIGFVGAIAFLPGASTEWHEWAGEILLLELLGALVASAMLRQFRSDPRPLPGSTPHRA